MYPDDMTPEEIEAFLDTVGDVELTTEAIDAIMARLLASLEKDKGIAALSRLLASLE